jgi:microcin C transport system permease protein
MTFYFLRRFLLIIPTFLGITIITFTILQVVPGGPLEMELLKLRGMGSPTGEVGTSGQQGSGVNIPESALEEMKNPTASISPFTCLRTWLNLWLTGKSYVFAEPWDVIISRFLLNLLG